MRAAQARRAYTLLEIILVMALIVIMSAIAIPVMQSMLSDARVTAAGDQVRGKLADTRANAMAEGRPWRLAFLPNTGVFQMAPEESTEWDSVVQDPIQSADFGPQFGSGGRCNHALDAPHGKGEWIGAEIKVQTPLLAQYAVAHYLEQDRVLDADVVD